MKFRNILINETKIKENIIKELQKITSDQSTGAEVLINNQPYNTLETIYSNPGTMFYTINANGKFVSKKMQGSNRVKRFTYNNREYLVTNLLDFQGKKWIKEVMYAEV